ncbi:hypothetical protein, partial [uncultured Microbulbifer sp.]|uniref:hypothetical protein n=1 Tax=uncultured Microbulbifer sp. TaxID=348147 RepID=UPI002611DF35
HYSDLFDLGKGFLNFFFREKLVENQSLILPSRCALRCRSSSEGANYTSPQGPSQALSGKS